mmetsp:Transcript_20977/g.41586  ORF Transcript_20977/g.41586 Transcript_20977/m.41586 type:complete len:81 (+) Transcript_20977:842-1084(+)
MAHLAEVGENRTGGAVIKFVSLRIGWNGAIRPPFLSFHRKAVRGEGNEEGRKNAERLKVLAGKRVYVYLNVIRRPQTSIK